MATNEKESVEALAERIVSHTRRNLDIHALRFAAAQIRRFVSTTMQPMDDGEKTDEQVSQYLADAGIDMEPANRMLREMVDNAKARREVIVSSESAWLIEVPHASAGSPLWYAGIGQGAVCHGKHGWTYDACKAKRFDDKAQAEAYIDDHKLREQAERLIVTQHGFDTYADPPQPPPSEPVVTERDRELAEKLGGNVNIGARIIARHNAAEREELEQSAKDWETTAYEKAIEITDLQAQLDAERAKHHEAYDVAVHLQAQLAEAKKRVGKLEDALRRMQPWAGKVIEAMGAMCMVAAETDAQPATPSGGK